MILVVDEGLIRCTEPKAASGIAEIFVVIRF